MAYGSIDPNTGGFVPTNTSPQTLTVSSGGGNLYNNPPKASPLALVGLRAKNPANNLKPASTTLPNNQVAPKDLSGTYAMTPDGTVYNKQSQTKFATAPDFFKDSGQTSFDNIKIDTNYTPTGKETIYGQPAAPNPNDLKIAGTDQSVNQAQGNQPGTTGANSVNTPGTTPPANTPPQYTPPNQGTGGVSQGGIIGNLLNFAQNESPEVAKARADLKTLTENYAKQTANIEGSPIDLSLATGQEGILNRLFAAKQGAAQTALSSALTSQGQQISATQGAGSLNAPITGVPLGTGVVSPSAPVTPGQVTGATGTGGALNPLNNLTSIAQQVLSGQLSPSQAESMGGSVAGWAGLLNNELLKQSNGAYDRSKLQAQYDANQNVQSTQAQTKAQYQSVAQQSQNLGQQLNDLLKTYNLNPNDLNYGNQLLQLVGNNLSDPRYQTFSNLINDLANTYAQVLTPGGSSPTDYARSIAASMLNPSASGQSLTAVIAALDQQVQAKIAGVQTPSTTGGTGNNTTLGLF